MHHPCDPVTAELPHLSDETAAHLLDVLQQIVTLVENHYAASIHRYYQRRNHQDLIATIPPPIDDPPF
jgi:hypothetical protein